MIKAIGFSCAEEIKKETVVIEHGIYNGFGKMIDLPSTCEMKFSTINFEPRKLGKLFIDMGVRISGESSNIKIIELKSELSPRVNDIGTEFIITLFYETTEKGETE